jgi:hypothetical protein
MMKNETEPMLDGPLEGGSWPDTLQARVITPGDAPRVHGYAVESDLACNYGYSEYLLLCLTGELPEPACVRAFDAASIFLGPVSVAHASTHAGVLSRLCGARNSGTIGVGAIGLAEQARELVAEHAALLGWLARMDRPIPHEYRAPRPDPSVERLASILSGVPFSVPALAEQPTRVAALLACLWSVGLKRAQQLEAAIVLARLPATLAESFAERATNFAHYPINLPRFRYREPVSPAAGACAESTEAQHG